MDHHSKYLLKVGSLFLAGGMLTGCPSERRYEHLSGGADQHASFQTVSKRLLRKLRTDKRFHGSDQIVIAYDSFADGLCRAEGCELPPRTMLEGARAKYGKDVVFVYITDDDDPLLKKRYLNTNIGGTVFLIDGDHMKRMHVADSNSNASSSRPDLEETVKSFFDLR